MRDTGAHHEGRLVKTLLPALVLALCAGAAAAETVRCVDAAGKTVYADSGDAQKYKYRNCRPVGGEINIVTPQPGTQTPPAGAAPRPAAPQPDVKDAEQRLEAAKKGLAEQESVRIGGEKNYQRVLDRLKPYQDKVEAAQRELDRARREAR